MRKMKKKAKTSWAKQDKRNTNLKDVRVFLYRGSQNGVRGTLTGPKNYKPSYNVIDAVQL